MPRGIKTKWNLKIKILQEKSFRNFLLKVCLVRINFSPVGIKFLNLR